MCLVRPALGAVYTQTARCVLPTFGEGGGAGQGWQPWWGWPLRQWGALIDMTSPCQRCCCRRHPHAAPLRPATPLPLAPHHPHAAGGRSERCGPTHLCRSGELQGRVGQQIP